MGDTFAEHARPSLVTKHSSFATSGLVAWLSTLGVKNDLEYIDMEAAAMILRTQKPVSVVALTTFMGDVDSPWATPSARFCGVLFELLVENGDPVPFSKLMLMDRALEKCPMHLGKLDLQGEQFTMVSAIAEIRVMWLNETIEALDKPFSLMMPDAEFSNNRKVKAF
ncbi:hypothetical protein L916_01624 [Phytophthora nicotianae]|nr:hypothetical protein L916_01624 [Phytophthora nicotianae]